MGQACPLKHLFHTTPIMKRIFKEIAGSIVAPQGFLAGGVFCDIKRLGTGKGSNKGTKTRPRADRVRSAGDGRGHVHDQPGLRRAGEGLRRAREKGNRPGHRRQFRQCQCLHRQTRLEGRAGNDGFAATLKQGRLTSAAHAKRTIRTFWSVPPAASVSPCRWKRQARNFGGGEAAWEFKHTRPTLSKPS